MTEIEEIEAETNHVFDSEGTTVSTERIEDHTEEAPVSAAPISLTKKTVAKSKKTQADKPAAPRRYLDFHVLHSGVFNPQLDSYFESFSQDWNPDPYLEHVSDFAKRYDINKNEPSCISSIIMNSLPIMDYQFVEADSELGRIFPSADTFLFLSGRAYHMGIQAFVISFNISSRQSFRLAQKLYEGYRCYMAEDRNYPENQGLGIILVGMPQESGEKREVSTKEASIFASAIDAPYLELKNSAIDQLLPLICEVAEKTKLHMALVYENLDKQRKRDARKRRNANKCAIM